MIRIAVLVMEIVLVAIAVFLANAVQENFNVIPRSILNFPQVDYTLEDFSTILKYFLLIHGVVFLFSQWLVGPWKADSKRTANELFALAAAFALSALTVFVTTTVSFDPNFLVLIAVFNALLFFLVYLVWSVVSGGWSIAIIGRLLTAILKRTFSISGVLILLLAVSPAVLAKLFTSDRDIANVVTQIRIYFSTTDVSEYAMVNALGNSKFQQPMLVRVHPSDSSTLYVLERKGRIVSVKFPTGGPQKTILDVRNRVGFVEVENGALGFAFHPQFGRSNSQNSGYIYLYYTDVRDGRQQNRLSRFDLSSGNPELIAQTETVLVELNRENSGFHNGGSVEFGSDGFLYLALGEGIRTAEFYSQADTLRKGVLRIDVDSRGGEISHPIIRQPKNGNTANYFIPNDNPFLNTGILEEYWAIGLRNPFRMSFDRQTGALWLGDVGSTKWEEVNLVKKGADYQFPYREGNEATSFKKPNVKLADDFGPVFTYAHTAYDRAVIGGQLYRGRKFPELFGKYLFADNYSSKIFSMPGTGEPVEEVTLIATANQFAQRGISSVAVLETGEILATTLGKSSEATGEILKLADKGEAAATASNEKSAVESEQVTRADAAEIFTTNCARCHGTNGNGKGPDSPLLGISIPDFTSVEYHLLRSDDELISVISQGGPGLGLSPMMPPWAMILNEQEIRAIVSLIKEMPEKQH